MNEPTEQGDYKELEKRLQQSGSRSSAKDRGLAPYASKGAKEKSIQFPQGYGNRSDPPVWINFVGAEYSATTDGRGQKPDVGHKSGTYGGGGKKLIDITLPLPTNHDTVNKVQYGLGDGEAKGAIYDISKKNWQQFLKTGGGTITDIKDILHLSKVKGDRDMSQIDSVYQGGNHREHHFSWVLIPQSEDDIKSIENISNYFQNFAFPRTSVTEPYSRTIHPAVWWISEFNEFGGAIREDRDSFINSPLPSVITSVSIKNTGNVEGGIYFTDRYTPAAVHLSVSFVELEPALTDTVGSSLYSRSQWRRARDRKGNR
jgi:hypothetical protein